MMKTTKRKIHLSEIKLTILKNIELMKEDV